ncbi:MAG: RNA polymerase sigma factor [Lachnospiraceae bacterium]|nr:RNA polymerase sigma factor [Lachnospiraceae bacterium]
MSIEEDVRKAVLKYSDILYKICIVILCNEQDVQDAIQETFCRYMEKKPNFRDEEHEKAWLIRVATNISRDMIRFRIRHPKVSIEELENSLVAPQQKETLRELIELPIKQKMVIYLHYVEGYHIKEIADILGITEGAVKMRLQRGRQQMKLSLKEV